MKREESMKKTKSVFCKFCMTTAVLLLISGFTGCGTTTATTPGSQSNTTASQAQAASTTTVAAANGEDATTTAADATTAAAAVTTTQAQSSVPVESDKPSDDDKSDTTQAQAPTEAVTTSTATNDAAQDGDKEIDPKPIVEILMRNGGIIVLELDRAAAPITVDNFVKLANEQFYDGLIFHRIVAGFMIQGGDPDGTGMGGPDYMIKGEFASNGWDNPIKHTRGVISMARSRQADSAGSQFFIMHADAPFLDGEYAAFGQVVEGMDIVDRIAEAEFRGESPVEPEVMESVRILDKDGSILF